MSLATLTPADLLPVARWAAAKLDLSGTDREDFSSDLVLHVLQRWDKGWGPGKILHLARWLWCDRRDRERFRERHLRRYHELRTPGSWDDPTIPAQIDELRAKIASLPPSERLVLGLLLDGLPGREVANCCGISEPSVWRLRRSALNHLRRSYGAAA